MGDTLSAGVPVGSGLACAGGLAHRFNGTTASSEGIATLESPVGVVPNLIHPGSTFHFQFWYRDATPVNPCLTGNNLSNAYSVTFVP